MVIETDIYVFKTMWGQEITVEGKYGGVPPGTLSVWIDRKGSLNVHAPMNEPLPYKTDGVVRFPADSFKILSVKTLPSGNECDISHSNPFRSSGWCHTHGVPANPECPMAGKAKTIQV